MSLPLSAPIQWKEAALTPRRDVAFESGGVTCRAWAYAPARRNGRPAPCIVMAHGLGGTRECALEPYALRFAASGFNVLLFDYRYFGASEGSPRQLIDIGDQLEDWSAAIHFARTMPGVDPDRIGLWGTSLSGGHVLTMAAREPDVAAIVAQCPMLDGAASARLLAAEAGFGAMARLAGAALDDTLRQFTGREPRYVPLAGRPGEVAAMTSHDTLEGMRTIVPPYWTNAAPARVLLAFPFYRPVRHAADVTCPALFITCDKDSVTAPEAAVTAAKRMGGLARVMTLPIGHFDIYLGEWLERSAGAEAAFFRDKLGI